MGRRISDSDPNGKKPCAFCRTMRVVVIFAVMVVMLMAYANKLHWLENIDFTSLFGYLVVVFFCVVLGYRVWDEYGRPKLSHAELEAKRAVREKQFDELDALVAERAEAERIEAERIEAERIETERIEAEELDAQQPATQEQLGEQFQEEIFDLADEAKLNSEPEQLDLLGFSTQKKPD